MSVHQINDDRIRDRAVEAQEALMDSEYRTALIDRISTLHPHTADRILNLYWDALADLSLLIEALDIVAHRIQPEDLDPEPFG